ncbi:MAG: NAD-dependent epimerase/dehydratase family protein, partial [Xanthomonadales bacterium]|nr:NAD-dependent epimerase/dehydratase family protein [Xanthomonadales bacterium]
LMNPAYPGGLEILAASKPRCIVLQHAPARTVYDGFPDYPLHPLKLQIQALANRTAAPFNVYVLRQRSSLHPSKAQKTKGTANRLPNIFPWP